MGALKKTFRLNAKIKRIIHVLNPYGMSCFVNKKEYFLVTKIDADCDNFSNSLAMDKYFLSITRFSNLMALH